MAMTDVLDWHLVVPVKGGATAKSRLHPPPGVARSELALALATDCLAACCESMPPGRVAIVTSDRQVARVGASLGATVLPDPGHGLNAAIAAGCERAVADGGSTAVAVLLADLPALRAHDLVTALRAAAAYPRAVVPDADGRGTVLLTAVDGRTITPQFGPDSAARHEAAGHVRLDLALPRLRTDVDDDAALMTAVALGVGPATLAVLGTAGHLSPTTLWPMQASVHRFDDDSGAGSVLLDDGREVAFSGEVFAASALRHVRTGQRLSITLDDADQGVSRLWIVGIGDDEKIG
jgi:2-phospho-L-lactate/phosphoenolpyruvate guanylyltransferase